MSRYPRDRSAAGGGEQARCNYPSRSLARDESGVQLPPPRHRLVTPPSIPMPPCPWGAVASLTSKPTLAFCRGEQVLLFYMVCVPSPPAFPSLGTGWWHLPGMLLLGTAPRHVCRHRRRQPRSRHRRQPGMGERGQPCPEPGSGVHIPPAPPILLLIFNFISQRRA